MYKQQKLNARKILLDILRNPEIVELIREPVHKIIGILYYNKTKSLTYTPDLNPILIFSNQHRNSNRIYQAIVTNNFINTLAVLLSNFTKLKI